MKINSTQNNITISKITIFVPLLMNRAKRSLSLSKGRVNNYESLILKSLNTNYLKNPQS